MEELGRRLEIQAPGPWGRLGLEAELLLDLREAGAEALNSWVMGEKEA